MQKIQIINTIKKHLSQNQINNNNLYTNLDRKMNTYKHNNNNNNNYNQLQRLKLKKKKKIMKNLKNYMYIYKKIIV